MADLRHCHLNLIVQLPPARLSCPGAYGLCPGVRRACTAYARVFPDPRGHETRDRRQSRKRTHTVSLGGSTNGSYGADHHRSYKLTLPTLASSPPTQISLPWLSVCSCAIGIDLRAQCTYLGAKCEVFRHLVRVCTLLLETFELFQSGIWFGLASTWTRCVQVATMTLYRTICPLSLYCLKKPSKLVAG